MARVSTQQRLQKIRTSIDIWRWTRVKRSPMPEELWTPAVQMAKQLGVWRVARALGLSYGALRRRVEEKTPQTETTMGFVEMRGADLMPEMSADGAVIEVCASDGTRLVVRLGRGAMVDPTALVTAFRQQAR